MASFLEKSDYWRAFFVYTLILNRSLRRAKCGIFIAALQCYSCDSCSEPKSVIGGKKNGEQQKCCPPKKIKKDEKLKLFLHCFNLIALSHKSNSQLNIDGKPFGGTFYLPHLVESHVYFCIHGTQEF